MATIKITPVDVLKTILTQLSLKYQFIKTIQFDPELDYVNSLTHARQNLTQTVNQSNKAKFPLLSWSRSVMRKADQSRSMRFTTLPCGLGPQELVKFTMTEMDFRFVLFTSNVRDIESFEVDWYLLSGIREITSVEVVIKNEPISFSVIWGDNLEDLTFNLEGNYYKSLAASAKITGPIVSITELNEDEFKSIIEEISFNILSCSGSSEIEKHVIKPIYPLIDEKAKLYSEWLINQGN